MGGSLLAVAKYIYYKNHTEIYASTSYFEFSTGSFSTAWVISHACLSKARILKCSGFFIFGGT